MNLDRVTITGADDSVSPSDLVALSRQFPFVEWGILFSPRHQGAAPRYPSRTWLRALEDEPGALRLSAHLCGQWVKDFVLGGAFTWAHASIGERLVARFKRVQLNFHGRFHQAAPTFLSALDDLPHEFILQCDSANDATVNVLAHRNQNRAAQGAGVPTGADCVPLFDRSGGTGVLPETWPQAWPGIYCGYAGGLGPDNVKGQLAKIAAAANGGRFWIDMERRVRSDDDRQFDLTKVYTVLAAVAPLVSSPVAA